MRWLMPERGTLLGRPASAWLDGEAREHVAPAFVAASSIIGEPTVGQVLTRTRGTWTGFPPPQIQTQWRHGPNTDGSGGSGWIAGNSFAVTEEHLGRYIGLRTRASNTEGETGWYPGTAAVGPVQPALAAPIFTEAPSLTGTARPGQTLTATAGAVTGHPEPLVEWRWQYQVGGGTWHTFVARGSQNAYVVQAGDIGRTIRAQVIASNSEGETDWQTAGTVGPVQDVPSQNLPPELSEITHESILVSWTLPFDGGSPITRTVLQYRVVGAGAATTVNDLLGPVPLSGLEPETHYEFRVRSDNSIGSGTFSAWTRAWTAAQPVWLVDPGEGEFTIENMPAPPPITAAGGEGEIIITGGWS